MSLRLPDDLTERLREAAKEEGRSMNGAAVIAIEHWLDRREAGHVQSLFEGHSHPTRQAARPTGCRAAPASRRTQGMRRAQEKARPQKSAQGMPA
jgi:hypothetical protein